MLEIIALVLLSRQIGQLAVRKGLPSLRWKLYLIGAWVGLELVGVIIGLALFGDGNLVGVGLFGLMCGIGGYLLVRAYLNKLTDADINEDINNFGR